MALEWTPTTDGGFVAVVGPYLLHVHPDVRYWYWRTGDASGLGAGASDAKAIACRVAASWLRPLLAETPQWVATERESFATLGPYLLRTHRNDLGYYWWKAGPWEGMGGKTIEAAQDAASERVRYEVGVMLKQLLPQAMDNSP